MLAALVALLSFDARCSSPTADSIESLVACSFDNTHSNPQGREDLQLLPLLIYAAATSKRRNAHSFVELGAYDGLSGSNTFMIEKCLNWTGTLVEANVPNFGMLLKSNRSAAMVNAGVCPTENGTILLAYLLT